MLKLAAVVAIIVILQFLFGILRRTVDKDLTSALARFPKTELAGRSVDDSGREAQIRRERDQTISTCWFAQIVITILLVIGTVFYAVFCAL